MAIVNHRKSGAGDSPRRLRALAPALFAVLMVNYSSYIVFGVENARRPNVLLILTDDQGWGDLGWHGNPVLKTPNLDRLAGQSVEFSHFYVSPVCSPTRASLLTGRYNYRTGVVDTYLGRSTMVGEETTLGEMFSAAGYRTAIFGKWHLGDNYPSRPVDQGFSEALVHRGGGIGQPADPPGNRYFDPVLLHNGRELQTQGYCSDVFTDAAIRFIGEHRNEQFFTYLSFNCPHAPLEVPPEYHARYRGIGLDEETARIYGMVANIDENVGRLLTTLKRLDLEDRTIVIFMTDNGPQSRRFNGVLRDLKGTVYDGGIRAPFFIRWSGKFRAGTKIDQHAAHIDVAPTLLDACGITRPANICFDGRSLLPLLLNPLAVWPERMLFFQWHRGDHPQQFRACAVRSSRYKLVQAAGRDGPEEFHPVWELFDMVNDPGEQHDILAQKPQLAAAMKTAYEKWFADVSKTRGYPSPRIVVGTLHENPVTLTRQDWRGAKAGWSDGSLGFWQIDVAVAGTYDITLRVPACETERISRLRIGESQWSEPVAAAASQAIYRGVRLKTGSFQLEALVERPAGVAGVHYVDILRHEPDDGR